MEHNVEIAGVHLADCTLLDYLHKLEIEEKKSGKEAYTRSSVDLMAAKMSAKQLASPYIRSDGELISTNIALSSLYRAEAERKERLLLKKKHQYEKDALFQQHDGMRGTIIDAWALEFEKIAEIEKKAREAAYFKERRRRMSEWQEFSIHQHLADDVRLWADMDQVLASERDAGRLAYRRESMISRK